MGFPTMKSVYDRFKNNDEVVFLVVQTVFEGHFINTFDKLESTQEKFKLPIPMGHDDSKYSEKHHVPTTMVNYRTGGTPWVVIIDKKGMVVFNQFHIQADNAVELIRTLLSN